jgi:regulatory protein YycH of two-component signal transduction system YycFG
MSLSAAVVGSFPTPLRIELFHANHSQPNELLGTSEFDLLQIDHEECPEYHHISHDSIHVVVQTVQDHQVAQTTSTPATELRLYDLNQIHAKGLIKFHP